VIDAFIDELAALKPNLASVETIGQTSEGRDIKLLKVSTGGRSSLPFPFRLSSPKKKPKKNLFFDCLCPAHS
jgi:hypothetical protein